MTEVPVRAARRIRDVCDIFVTGLRDLLREDLAAVYFHGSGAFPDSQTGLGDLDFHVIVHGSISPASRKRLDALHRDIADRVPVTGGDLDIWYITEKAARGRRPPRHLLHPAAVDRSWALHRAHWLAGRVVILFGVPPSTLCIAPTWVELSTALRHEFRFVIEQARSDRNFAYCVLNACRVLYSVRTRDVVVSKGHAAGWAARALPPRYHRVIKAALLFYKGVSNSKDRAVLQADTMPFLRYASARVRAPFGRQPISSGPALE